MQIGAGVGVEREGSGAQKGDHRESEEEKKGRGTYRSLFRGVLKKRCIEKRTEWGRQGCPAAQASLHFLSPSPRRITRFLLET